MGPSWEGKSRQDRTRQDKTGQDRTRQDKTRQRQDKTRLWQTKVHSGDFSLGGGRGLPPYWGETALDTPPLSREERKERDVREKWVC